MKYHDKNYSECEITVGHLTFLRQVSERITITLSDHFCLISEQILC